MLIILNHCYKRLLQIDSKFQYNQLKLKQTIMLICQTFAVLVLCLTLSLARGALLPAVPQLDGRIVGGREVTITKHPHQVSLRYKQCRNCAYSHTCGGSLYAADIVITAAHCVQYRSPINFIVVAGTDNRNGADGHVSRVKRIIRHEDYNFSTTDNDVSLLFLSSPLPLDGLHMATIGLADVVPQNGEKSVISGWGTTTEGGYASAKLFEVNVPIVSNDLCNQYYGAGRITDSMLCAGAAGGGKDACQGDSGGPLLVNGSLTGIVSWGRGCGRPDYPGVYASVPHLKKWIVDTIAEQH